MFEETELPQNQLPNSPRMKACLSQCRLMKFKNGGTIFEGGCPCDRGSECKFQLPPIGDEDEHFLAFPDLRSYWKDLVREAYKG